MTEYMRIRTSGLRTDDVPEEWKCFYAPVRHMSTTSKHHRPSATCFSVSCLVSSFRRQTQTCILQILQQGEGGLGILLSKWRYNRAPMCRLAWVVAWYMTRMRGHSSLIAVAVTSLPSTNPMICRLTPTKRPAKVTRIFKLSIKIKGKCFFCDLVNFTRKT
jgi:hypothetical protein